MLSKGKNLTRSLLGFAFVVNFVSSCFTLFPFSPAFGIQTYELGIPHLVASHTLNPWATEQGSVIIRPAGSHQIALLS